MNHCERISINLKIRFGKPCITGTRIAVQDILQWLASGMTYEEILSDFPPLKNRGYSGSSPVCCTERRINSNNKNCMKLLLDANLSWRLANVITDHFQDVRHLDKVGMKVTATDIEIWQYVKKNQNIGGEVCENTNIDFWE